MSLNLMYTLKEGWTGLRRARLASIVTITTVAVALFLFGSFLFITLNVRFIVETYKRKMSVEVFIDNSMTADQIADLRKRLLSVPGVQKADFVSKDDALKKFQEEMGEDPTSLLGENPLPASFLVTVTASHRTPDLAETVVGRIDKLEGVEQTVYNGRLFRRVDQWSRKILIADLSLLILVLGSSLLLVANTLRLTLLAQSKNIQIKRLVGATRWFIRMPYLIQGMLEGGLGGLISSALLWVIIRTAVSKFPMELQGILPAVLVPILLGIFLGFFGSIIGLRRFLKM
jgi:cell division transport system permease protein